jgi:hypothetical protein
LEHLELDDITETMLDEMDACDEECRPDDAGDGDEMARRRHSTKDAKEVSSILILAYGQLY